jgi:beta-1,4-mannosyl-glycoprotein beta-1,4-N-acetylglucosaminyltransferase
MLLLMADVDEVPFEAALQLLKACNAPLPMHLQLQNYLYSFEWPTLADSWRAQVHKWSDAKRSGGYRHGQSSENVLASSGWHCR